MEALAGLIRWFGDPAHWAGAGGIPARIFEHVQITALALLAASAVALPAGLFIGHTRRGRFIVISIANIGRAIPSFAILGLLVPFSLRMGLGLGFWPTTVALFLLAIPPILTNTFTGVAGVDGDVVDAARGMGMSPRDILLGIEVPLAAPLIAVGVRIATVQVIATATLAALVAWGGLGRFIVDGFATRDLVQVAAGAILVAFLAIAAELGLGFVERLATPRGMAPRSRQFRPVPAISPDV